jgi:hypothetical protein
MTLVNYLAEEMVGSKGSSTVDQKAVQKVR